MAVCYASDGIGQNFCPVEFNLNVMNEVELTETAYFSGVPGTLRQHARSCK
jgi:hypothetical protein